MDELNLQEVLDQLSSQMFARLDSLPYASEEEYQEDQQIIVEFNKIAASMLQQEPGLEMPGAQQPIPLDAQMVLQALSLFAEGIYFALVKCKDRGLFGELKKSLLQNLAMEVYNQAKQVVAATYGQEHTPEFQFTHDQQIEIIHNATGGYFVAFIAEYEQVNGPIPEPAAPELPSSPQPAPQPSPQASPQPQTSSAAQSAPIKTPGATPHDKYGAVALLLTTLSASQRARILKNFNQEEKELIQYYSNPQNLEQNLDLASVETHLKKFKELLKQGGASSKTPASKGIAQLAKHTPLEKLLSCVKDERPLVKRYLQSHYADEPVQSGHRGPQPDHQNAEPLPARIEEILYRHLSKRLAPPA